MTKVVKGLYHLECEKRLPHDVKIEVRFAQDQYDRLIVPELMPYAQKTDVAENILSYWRCVAADKPTASLT